MDILSYLLGKKAGGETPTPPKLQEKNVTITENGTQNVTPDASYDGLSKVSITTDVSGASDLDWTVLGYENRPEIIDEDYNYAKQIKDTWVPAASLKNKFNGNNKLSIMPFVDTSTTTEFTDMFTDCNRLTTVPVLDLSSATTLLRMFRNDYYLSDESLNNILKMCISATSFTGYKGLTQLGFSSSFYPAERIQSLPNYQDFIDAGWQIGY